MRFGARCIAAWLAIAVLAAPACAPLPDGEYSGDTSGFSIDLRFPPGYEVDRTTGELYGGPSDELGRAAPSYVTSVTILLVGEEGDFTFNVPLDTGEVSGTVPPGDYLLTVTVTTSLGLTFTGAADVTLVAGNNGIISIDLIVNAPPVIESLTASTTTPRPGEKVSLAATVTDPDGDPITFAWSASGGNIDGFETAASWVSSVTGSFTVTLKVSDGRGGSDSASVTITPGNEAPVITSVTVSNPNPLYLERVTATCLATDADNDPITYTWSSSADGWTATGSIVTYVTSTPAEITLTCEAIDIFGAVAVGTVVLNAGSNGIPGAPQSVVATAGTKQVTITWGAVVNAVSYNLYWGIMSGGTVNQIAGVNSGYVHTGRADGTVYFYVVTAVTVAGEGPASLEVSDITAPATPTGLTATPGNGKVTLNWNAVTGAVSYNIYRSTAPAPAGKALIANVPSPATSFVHLTPNWQWNYYTVAAVNATATSLPSGEVSAYPFGLLGAPGLPDLFAAWDSGVSSLDNYTFQNPVSIGWGGVVGAEGYRIYRNGGFYADVGNLTSASVVLVNNATTNFQIMAYNATAGVNSALSPTLAITHDLAAPSYTTFSPAGFWLAATTQTITFNYSEPVWHQSVTIVGGSGAAGYGGGNGTTSIKYNVRHTNTFVDMVIKVIVGDRAGNTNTLTFTFPAPHNPI